MLQKCSHLAPAKTPQSSQQGDPSCQSHHIQEAQAFPLSRVRRPPTNNPDRQRRKKHRQSQVASLVVVFGSQLGPRAIDGARCILASSYEDGGHDIRRVDIRRKLAVADLSLPRNPQRLIQIRRTTLQNLLTDTIGNVPQPTTRTPRVWKTFPQDGFLSDVIWPSSRIFCICISLARPESINLSQHRCVATDTIFYPAASTVSKSKRACTVEPVTCGVNFCSCACELAVRASFSNCACRVGTNTTASQGLGKMKTGARNMNLPRTSN